MVKRVLLFLSPKNIPAHPFCIIVLPACTSPFARYNYYMYLACLIVTYLSLICPGKSYLVQVYRWNQKLSRHNAGVAQIHRLRVYKQRSSLTLPPNRFLPAPVRTAHVATILVSGQCIGINQLTFTKGSVLFRKCCRP